MSNTRRENILETIAKYHPSSIDALKENLSQDGIHCSDEEILDVLQELESGGKVIIHRTTRVTSFASYLREIAYSWWIYATVLVSFAETLLVFYGTNLAYSESLRLLFGLALLGFLPGYSTVQILFPRNELKFLEGALLSVFLSVVISTALGVALGADYFFRSDLIVTASAIYTVTVTFAAGYRRYSFLRHPLQ